MPTLSRYLPADRLRALAGGAPVPERAPASLLHTDLAGFSALAQGLLETHAAERAPEALKAVLDRVFEVVARVVHTHGGSVVTFAGDSVLCHFVGDEGVAATAAACEIRDAVAALPAVPLAGGRRHALRMTSLVGAGEVRRVVVGDERFQLLEVVTGPVVRRLDAARAVAASGEVLVDAATARALGERAERSAPREASGETYVAIASLDAHAAAPLAPARAADASLTNGDLRPWISRPVYDRAASGRGPFACELRPVVALFAAYPGLAELDTVDRAALDALVRWVQGVLRQHDAHYLQFTTGEKGGYFYAAFGAPLAHGDDAVAALATAAELAAPPEALRAWLGAGQVGVAAGRAHAGEYGGAERTEYGVLGDVVNLAARLMALAAPGEVLVAGPVGATAQRRFVLDRAEPLAVRGRPHPVAVQRLRGARAASALREPTEAGPIVGRDAELRSVDALLAAALAGAGRCLLVEAEPGVGKSRLVAEAIARAEARGMAVLAGEAPAFGGSAPLAAWLPVTSALFGVPAAGPPAEREAALRAVAAERMPALVPMLPVVAPMLGLTLPDTEHTGAIPAPVRKQIAQEIVVESLRRRAAAHPILLVLEDAHWLDAASRDLADAVAAGVGDAPVLLVIARRPAEDGAPPLLAAARDPVRLSLAPLGSGAVDELLRLQLRHLFGVDAAPPAALSELVRERTGGNPLHVEELMRYLADLGVDPFDAPALARSNLPDSLQRVILERLDRLPEREREVIKVAAVAGRRFPAAWLPGADPGLGDETSVRDALDRLSRLDITPVHETAPEAVYLFKHAVTRDVAYGTLTHESRVRLHATLGAWLEARLGESAPELLALHFGLGERADREMYYSALAGERAVQQAAYADALAHLERGLALAAAHAELPEREATELRLLLALGGVLLIVKGQGSPEAKAVYDRAAALCERVPRSPEVVRALFGLWTYYFFAGDAVRASELARGILEVAEMIGAPEPRMNAHFAVSATALLAGDPEGCIAHAARVAALYDPAQAAGYVARYAQNPRVTAMTNAAPALVLCGRYREARAVAAETVAHAESLGHELVLDIALQIPPFVHVHLGDPAGAARAAAAWMPLAQKQGNPVYVAFCGAVLAWAGAAAGDAAALAQLRGVREGFLAQGVALADPLFVAMTADAALRQGRHTEGLALLDAFEPAAAARGQRGYAHEVQRLRGELLRLAGAPDAEVERCFREAIAIADAQRAHGVRLRAALSLARLLDARGRGDEGRALVADALARVDLDDEAPDVVAARDLVGAAVLTPAPSSFAPLRTTARPGRRGR